VNLGVPLVEHRSRIPVPDGERFEDAERVGPDAGDRVSED